MSLTQFLGNDAADSLKPALAPFEAILTYPVLAAGELRRPPIVLYPHGGPHSASDGGFNVDVGTLVGAGFAVLLVNYRGSTGFGQNALESLSGKGGEQDVDDCMQALEAAVATGLVDGTRACVLGGSHGGFLAAHLISQFPTRFLAAAARNPVISIAFNMSMSV
jgi:acylaminoacyl-peptidase